MTRKEPELEPETSIEKIKKYSIKPFKTLKEILGNDDKEFEEYIQSNELNNTIQDVYSQMVNDLYIQDTTKQLIYIQSIFPLVEFIYHHRTQNDNIIKEFIQYQQLIETNDYFLTKNKELDIIKVIRYLEYIMNEQVICDDKDEIIHKFAPIMFPIYLLILNKTLTLKT
jgi:uncharacterized protein YjdB